MVLVSGFYWFDIVIGVCELVVMFEVDNLVICFNDGCVDL